MMNIISKTHCFSKDCGLTKSAEEMKGSGTNFLGGRCKRAGIGSAHLSRTIWTPPFIERVTEIKIKLFCP